jgi:hypothetical protein
MTVSMSAAAAAAPSARAAVKARYGCVPSVIWRAGFCLHLCPTEAYKLQAKDEVNQEERRFREVKGDRWQLADEAKPDAICITTNGDVKRNGQAALVRGCALETAMRLPMLPVQLGDWLRHNELRTLCLTIALGHLWQATHLLYRFIASPVGRREVPASEFNRVSHQRLHVRRALSPPTGGPWRIGI